MGQRRLDLSPRQPGGQHRQWVAKIDHLGQRLAKEVGAVGRIGHWQNSQKSDSDPAILRGSGCACNGRKPSVRAAWRGFAGRTTYDALGRRLKKEVIIGNASADASTLDIHYYGWDGDRLIHTEHLDPEHPGERQITHTVYEPQSFTPMLRLSTCGKAAAKPHRLVQALQERTDAPEDEAALASLQAALQALPASMQQSLNEATTQALEQGLPASALTMLGDEGPATRQHLQRMKKRLHEEAEQQKPPVEIHFYHCDHLGTPIALTDRNHHVIWAAKLDPWGNLEEEYNPNRIDQPIRLPGQHHDRETGLYYNRHRYYDPGLGSYISQDPIGLRGGANTSIYVDGDPNFYIDPTGLQAYMSGAAGLPAWCPPPIKPKPSPPKTTQACYRPLRNTPLVIGNATDRKNNSVIGHQHIFFPDGTNVGYGPEGIFRNEDISEYGRCVDINRSKEDISKKIDALKDSEFRPDQYRMKPRIMGGNNCQDFVEAVTGVKGL